MTSDTVVTPKITLHETKNCINSVLTEV